MKLLRVDMQELRVRYEPVPTVYERLGGRALIAKLLLEEIPPTCDALGIHNKLIFAPGLLGGAGVVAAGRLSVGGKSPLTGGVKEANAGGTAGEALGRLNLKSVVIEKASQSDHWYLLHIKEDQSSELVQSDDLHGLGNYTVSEKLQKTYGEDCTVISIGPAGELKLHGAGVTVTGINDQRSNQAARGGLGALMGSKRLKAIVIDKPISKRQIVDAELLKTANRTFAMELYSSPKLGKQGSQHLYGTASIVSAVNEMGSMPTHNFREGKFEGAQTLRGEHMRATILERGGKIGTNCMPGCVISCRNLYVDKQGKPIVGTLQYETIALMGSNLGLSDLDDVAHLNYLCNDLGLDSIETGAALGVAIEAGLAKFGDYKSIAALLKQVSQGTEIGLILGNGAAATGKALGIDRIPVALGQAIPGYDPRSLKGNGVTYATSPQGADHTAGNAFGARNEVNPLGTEGQCELSLKLQIIAAMLDSTGLCLFARPPIIANPQLMVDMINGIYGWNWTVADYNQFNREVLLTELEFNRRAGITAENYRIPKYMQNETLPPHQAVFDIPDDELDHMFSSL